MGTTHQGFATVGTLVDKCGEVLINEIKICNIGNPVVGVLLQGVHLVEGVAMEVIHDGETLPPN